MKDCLVALLVQDLYLILSVIMYAIFQGFNVLTALLNIVSAQLLPDSQVVLMNELEHLYFDDTGPQGFKSGIVPCTNYVDSTTGLDNNTLGRQTSAQWLRTAFRKIRFPRLVHRKLNYYKTAMPCLLRQYLSAFRGTEHH